MKYRTLLSAATIAALASASVAANAGDQTSNLKEWIKGASEAVDDIMYYPSMALSRNKEGTAVFEVTIDRNGNVKSFETVDKIRSAGLNSAARRVVTRADFPALPSNYDHGEMTFDLVLDYQISSGYSYNSRAGKVREGKVDTQELAKQGRRQTASIRIHSANGR